MTSFSTVFQKNRRFASYGLALMLFIVIAVSPNFIRAHLGNVANLVFYYFFSEIENYKVSLTDMIKENRILRNQAAENALQLNFLNEIKRENIRLRDELDFSPPPQFRKIHVRIVSLTYVNDIYPIYAVINKGSSDWLTVDMPVISRFGLVGRVKEVMPEFSIVSLLTDPANAVSVRVADSRQIGIVRFSRERRMYLDNLPADAIVGKNDLIMTSGLGGIYPAGLAVAQVDSAYAENGEILKKVWLTPAVDFLKIDELFVLSGGGQ